MAKKPKKAPAGDGEAGAENAKNATSRKKLMMIAAGAVVALGAVGGGFLMMKGDHGGEAQAHGEAPSGGHGEQAAAHGGGHGGGHGDGHGGGHGDTAKDGTKPVAAFLELRDLIVNLSPEPGQAKGGFLKLRVVLELKDAGVEAEVKPLLPRVEDTFQTYMRELRASDLGGSIGLYRLREELLRRVNVAIHPAKAEAVLFKDVVVQ